MRGSIQLVLFESDAERAAYFYEQGIDSFMVDLEFMGKNLRQLGFDTEIRPGSLEDLRQIAAMTGVEAWCRINGFGDHSPAEIEDVIAAGADVVVLPMVTKIADAEAFIRQVDGRARATLMIETMSAAYLAEELSALRPAHIFFGLNDFAISRGGGSIFRAISDGTVEQVRRAMPGISFGFGGLTDPQLGNPIPSMLLLEEMERLDCQFTFLRRSFHRDTKNVAPRTILDAIGKGWASCRSRTPWQRRYDHDTLLGLLDAL